MRELSEEQQTLTQELEQNIIGSALQDNHRMRQFVLHCKAEWFYFGIHQRTWEYILKAVAKNPDFGSDAFIYHLDKAENVKGEGGALVKTTLADYLKELRDNAVGVFGKGPAEALYAMYRKRMVRRQLMGAIDAVDASGPDEDILATATQAIDALQQEASSQGGNIFVSAKDVALEIAKEMEEERACYVTGLRTLDTMFAGGLYAGKLYGLGGAEKSGKTTLAMTLSASLAEQGVKHVYLCFESESKDLMQKLIAARRGFNSLKFLEASGDFDRGHMAELATAEAEKVGENILFVDMHKRGMTDWNDVRMVLHQAQAKKGVKGVIVDYWQLIGGASSRQTEEKHLRTVADSFATWTRLSGLWCVLLAQLNKDGGLFAGNGLRKACDALVFVKEMDEAYRRDFPSGEWQRWLKCDAIRYTLRRDAGSPKEPAIMLDTMAGPLFREIS